MIGDTEPEVASPVLKTVPPCPSLQEVAQPGLDTDHVSVVFCPCCSVFGVAISEDVQAVTPVIEQVAIAVLLETVSVMVI